MRHMRSRILAYTKGFPGAKEMRSRLVRVSSLRELEELPPVSPVNVSETEVALLSYPSARSRNVPAGRRPDPVPVIPEKMIFEGS